ncbi:hypothetical protein Vretimale_12705 [Volvox reticuliferus]|uniref:CBM20 domain-containing protein n=1 Tax=Volvox reticuliferus TaxID=1737510 RepID=A0A8J4D1F1_9CHLO|nr:hypothetical protein Vretifemale_20855 [Volvox reticuliferus]GIM08721.1 hypothetical protein Vretimale_12705 [Volvox reticuliferus]
MQPSIPVWRRPAPQQGRCRCLSRRAFGAVNMIQGDVQDHRPHFVNVSFKVEYKCSYGQSLTLVGNTAPLGNWSFKRGQRMHWSRGDVWTCNVMLPAGSDVECKYVIVDDQGRAQRWQEGSNMVVSIPDTYQGLPLQRYDVGVSWCKNHVNYRYVAAPPNTAQDLNRTYANAVVAAAAAAAAADPAAAMGTVAGAAPPVMAWALSKGANPIASLKPTPLVQQVAETQTSKFRIWASAPAGQCVAVDAQASPAQQQLSSAPSVRTQLAAKEALPGAAAHQAGTGAGSKVATLVQAAANAVCEAQTAPAGSSGASGAMVMAATSAGPLSSFQLSSASSDGEPTMSIVLAPRSKSPPVKISLSSSFSRLMDMPALSRSGGSNASAASTGASVSTPSTGKTTAASIQSHAIDSTIASSTHTAHISGGAAQSQVAPSSNGKPLVFPSVSANTISQDRNSSHNGQNLSTAAPASPTWGMEYDIYATAYGMSYMHTLFDLEAYKVYEQTGPDPSSSSLSSMSSGRLTHDGSAHDFVSANQSRGADLLESAVVAALSSGADTETAPTSAIDLFPPTLLGATAASTSLALGAATASCPAAPVAAAAATPPMGSDDAVASHPVEVVAPAPVEVYRQVSRSSTSISDWAGRTLIEMSSGHSLIDEDSDEDETADDEAAVAQALATPVAPADMAALLTQLGTALGRSVRLRYDGIDATAQDLLELDRKIALAASKLYRQRDNLLSGWLRKETRRQLATAAAAPVSRPPMPTSNTVTSL